MQASSKKPKGAAPAADGESARMRLGLGTAQFGLDYGIANKRGKAVLDEVRDIIVAAGENGLRVIDTAPAYGDSEAVLGQSLPRRHEFRIVTKTPIFGTAAISPADADRLRQTFEASLSRLDQKAVYGLLGHHADDLLAPGGERLMEAMTAIKKSGRVHKVGVSVYTSGQIDAILARYDIDLIQLPVNLFDQRLVRDGHLRKLKTRGIEIHARSVYLQGLLLLAPEDIPEPLATARPYIARLREDARREGQSLPEAALGFIKSIAEIDCAIIGVDSRGQLLENLKAFAVGTSLDFARYAVADEQILNPSLWNMADKN
jgi:aryl-alcohol dehydrogenase-like predicted oxidoreductase